MKHTIYAHKITLIGDSKTELKYAVKIGYTTNYKSRMKSYRSHGDPIHEILKVEVVSKEVDVSLKTWLTENKYNVTTNTKGSIEVYNLSETHAIKILKYIENNDTIDYNSLSYIINNNEVSLEKITLRTFRNRFGVDYIPHKFQRPIDKKHVELIKNGILECYNTPYYDIGVIHIVKLKNNQYGIIDGNHRAHAISSINKHHEILNSTIDIRKHNLLLCNYQVKKLFVNINNIIPVGGIYKSDEYISNIQKSVIKNIRMKFGRDCIIDDDKKSKNSIAIKKSTINNLITRKNLEYLIKSSHINNECEYICSILEEINNDIIRNTFDNKLDDGSIFDTSYNIVENKETREMLDFYKELNNVKNYPLKINPFLKKLNNIKNHYNKRSYKIRKKGSSVIQKRYPFMLSLIYKVSIMDVIKQYEPDDDD